jgi:hypothetical protein
MSGVANQWETVARYKKARRLASVLIALGITNEATIDDPAVRANLVALTGVKDPSEITWALTKYLVEEAA